MADSPPPGSILEGAALFLDFDGTLVDLARAPDAIAVPPGLLPLIERLAAKLEGRLAIVTGRAIADLERHVGPLQIALSGSHGVEIRVPGTEGPQLGSRPGLAEVQQEVSRFAKGRAGLLVEEKPGGVALHYRQAPALEDEVGRLMSELARRTGLRLQHGKMVAELLPAGADKGAALRRLMTEPPFAGARPVFVGDDLTDEHAFEAADALGGEGILVGPARETAARWRLEDVAAVWRWLGEAAGPA
jgi:trehalose 6-phosphate phosphatase